MCLLQTLGNHEFDNGPQLLSYFIGNLSFPMLGGCNIDTSGEPALRDKLKQHVVLQYGKFKVCGAVNSMAKYVCTRLYMSLFKSSACIMHIDDHN